MMDDRPNVQVIYTSKPAPGPGLLAILVELIGFALFLGLAAFVAGVMGKL